MVQKSQIYGLVLAGGRSRRLGRDKATLVYRGQLQVDRSVQMLKRCVTKTFVSLREDQDNPTTSGTAIITDRFGEVGPLGGLLSAFFHHRDKDWFLLSSAMPFVTLRELSQLREAAEGNQMATAFTNSQGLPVAQCAIYHAAYKDILLTEAKAGERSLQNILMKHGFQALQAKDPNIFDAVVTQDDYYEAQKRIVGV